MASAAQIRSAMEAEAPPDDVEYRLPRGAGDGPGVVGMAVVGTAVVGWADGMELVGSTVGEGVGTADGTAVVGENVGPCVGAAVGAQATVAVED